MSEKKTNWELAIEDAIKAMFDSENWQERFLKPIFVSLVFFFIVPSIIGYGFSIFWHQPISKKDFQDLLLFSFIIGFWVTVIPFLQELKQATQGQIRKQQEKAEQIINLRKLLNGENVLLSFSQLEDLHVETNPEFKDLYRQLQEKAQNPSTSPQFVALALATLEKTETHYYSYRYNKARVYGCELFETRTSLEIDEEQVKQIATKILASHPDKTAEILSLLRAQSEKVHKILC